MESNSGNLRALIIEKRDVSVHRGEKSALSRHCKEQRRSECSRGEHGRSGCIQRETEDT